MRWNSSAVDALHSGTVADVLDGLGVNGGFPSEVKCLNASKQARFFGKAHTVRWAAVRKSADIKAAQSSTWDQVKQFLVPECNSGVGLVYVSGTDNGVLVNELALVGGFSATDLQHRGFVALVLGGAARDAHVVGQIGIPVWSTGYVPADTQGSFRVVETGTWCNIGGQIVQTGDWVFGDESGVVKIPAGDWDRVIERAGDVEAVEDEILRRVSAGERLYDVVAEIGRL